LVVLELGDWVEFQYGHVSWAWGIPPPLELGEWGLVAAVLLEADLAVTGLGE
jgi:hypothetical protein